MTASPSFDGITQHMILFYLQIRRLKLRLTLLKIIFKFFHFLNCTSIVFLPYLFHIRFLIVFFIDLFKFTKTLSQVTDSTVANIRYAFRTFLSHFFIKRCIVFII